MMVSRRVGVVPSGPHKLFAAVPVVLVNTRQLAIHFPK